MTGDLCPICGKNWLADDGHEIRWAESGWEIVCPTPLVVEKPLAHCTVTGLEVKRG